MEATKHELKRCDIFDIIVQVTFVPLLCDSLHRKRGLACCIMSVESIHGLQDSVSMIPWVMKVLRSILRRILKLWLHLGRLFLIRNG